MLSPHPLLLAFSRASFPASAQARARDDVTPMERTRPDMWRSLWNGIQRESAIGSLNVCHSPALPSGPSLLVETRISRVLR